MQLLQNSEILSILMKDPRDPTALSCLRAVFQMKPHLPQDFIGKFIAIVSLKVNITQSGVGFINQSYNAKVIATNIKPLTKISNLTYKNRQTILRDEAIRSKNVITPNRKVPPQTLRLKFSDNLLSKCINCIADLSQTIIEGNRSNGYTCDEYIKTNMLRQ